MPWRWYPKVNKVQRADGTIAMYESRCKKWLKFYKPYKPQKRGLEKKSIYSKRFGLLELYNRKEQQQLICPSGYSISQCFNVLAKRWFAYQRARREDKDIKKVEKYARAIQDVDRNGKRMVFEDHSALKKKQDEYEKWQAENSEAIQLHVQKPHKEAGEEIKIFVDDIYPSKKQEPEEDEIVPDMLDPDEEEGEEEIIITDDTPFTQE